MLGTMADWSKGDLSDQQAFDLLMADREEVLEVYERAKAALDVMRGQLERIVQHAGGKLAGAGYEAGMVEPSTSASYDTREVDAVQAALTRSGDVDMMHLGARLAQ